MDSLIYSATEARANFFDILDLVNSGKSEIIITKDKKPVVRLVKEKIDKINKKNNLMSFAGVMSKRDADIFYNVLREIRNAPERRTPIKYGK